MNERDENVNFERFVHSILLAFLPNDKHNSLVWFVNDFEGNSKLLVDRFDSFEWYDH